MSVVASIADTITVLAARRHAGRRAVRRGVEEPAVIEAYMGSAEAELEGRRIEHGSQALRSRSTDLHAWYGESHVLHGVDFARRTRARW